MKLKIKTGTVGYNNKILVSDGNFILGKNAKVNSLETPAIKSHKTNSLETPTIESHSNTAQGLTTHTPTISHEDEKTALILFITMYNAKKVEVQYRFCTCAVAVCTDSDFLR